jgi:hypothetical protein
MEAEDETICMLLRGFKNPTRQKARVHAKENFTKKGTRRPVSDNHVDRRYAHTESKRTRVQTTNERSQITPKPSILVENFHTTSRERRNIRRQNAYTSHLLIQK